MIQIVLPVVVKTAAPLVLKGAATAGIYLAGITAVRWGSRRIFKAGADSVRPETPKKTFAQKVKAEMRFFGRQTLVVLKKSALGVVLLCVGIALAPTFPAVAVGLMYASIAVSCFTIIEELFDQPITRAVRWTARSIWGRVREAVNDVRFAWTHRKALKDIVTDVDEDVEAVFRNAAEPEIVPAEGTDPVGVNVTADTNAVFDEEADRDELAFQSRLVVLVGLLQEDDFRVNAGAATTAFFNELPETVFERAAAQKVFSNWLTQSSLTAAQKQAAKKSYASLLAGFKRRGA